LRTKVTTFFQIVLAKSTVQELSLSAGPTSEELFIKSVTISGRKMWQSGSNEHLQNEN